eukprot:TRINITY_DN4628_c0_g2_i4.p1 TRINITY_DN4628_c0_g2~~TRINITY_DN4628_c0_g2_i4.p1  ORF type:complete len:534 (-),score=81.74 TRINITY_DN4628_c0_g2_i4:58-1659(-)
MGIKKDEREEQESILKRIADKKKADQDSVRLAQKLQREEEDLVRKRAEEKEKESKLTCSVCTIVVELADGGYLEKCMHAVCQACLKDTIQTFASSSMLSEFECPVVGCRHKLQKGDILSVLSAEEYDQIIQSRSLAVILSKDIVKCPRPSCGESFERVVSNIAPFTKTERNEKGELISEEAHIHRETCRYRCAYCQHDFCSVCDRSPYHLGFTCDQVQARSQMLPCRFCAEPVDASVQIRGSIVCDEEECIERAETLCGKALRCGHQCGGVRDEPKCLPCLDSSCAMHDESTPDGGEFCVICYSEDLRAAPSVQLECGHVLHFHCIKTRLEKRWTASRIGFSYCECPACKALISHPLLNHHIQAADRLRQEIMDKALERLKREGLENCREVTAPNSEYYRKPREYAFHRYSYSMCFKCKKPYFTGQVQCAAGMAEFKPEDLLCAACSSVDGNCTNCPIHGQEYIQYKCRYCCNLAVWFCFGNTHFCEQCHQRPYEISGMPPHQLPRCNCSVRHPPNGQEFSLGCSLCRDDQGM